MNKRIEHICCQRLRSRIGQALVEFAVVLPLLLFVVFMMIEFSRAFHAYLAAENGVRQGIRYAVTGEFDAAYCPELGEGCADDHEEKAARLASIMEVAYNASETIMRNDMAASHDPGYFQTTVCVSEEPARYVEPDPLDPFASAFCTGGDDPGDPGDLVSVTVDFNHPLIIPGLTDLMPMLHIHTRREAIVEDFRTNREVSLPPIISPVEPGPVVPPEEQPDCSKMVMSAVEFDGSTLSALFHNSNMEDPALIQTILRKGAPMSERLHVTYLNFPYLSHGSQYYWHHSVYYPDVLTWAGNVCWPGGDEVLWGADFTGDKPIFGVFSAEIQFQFRDGLTCTFAPYVDVQEPEDPPIDPETPDPEIPDPEIPDPPDPPTPVPPTPVPPPPEDPGD